MNDLAGQRILVTRPFDDAREWALEIERRGGQPIVFPCLVTEPVHDFATAVRLREALDGATFLAVTSRRGVAGVAALLPDGLPEHVRVAAVGPETARAAEEALGRVDLVAADGNGNALARELGHALARLELAEDVRPRVVVAAADRAGRQIEEWLDPVGVEVVRVIVYRTIPAPPRHDKQDLAAWGVTAILLASPSAAEGLVHQALVPPSAHVLSIGPTTTQAALALGLRVTAEARHPGLDGLLEGLLETKP